MLLILLTKNLFFTIFNLYKVFSFINNFRINGLKELIIFFIFYFFINLYLLPTFASCETFKYMDVNLYDKENNTYKGSKILYQNEKAFVTQEELEYAQDVCRKVVKVCAVGLFITTTMYLYLLFMDK
jgi:hypothetical protein